MGAEISFTLNVWFKKICFDQKSFCKQIFFYPKVFWPDFNLPKKFKDLKFCLTPNIFTAAARWAQVVIMSNSYICVCVCVFARHFFKSQYKQLGWPGWFPGWARELGLLSVGLRRSLGWYQTPGWSASLGQSPFVVKICWAIWNIDDKLKEVK